MRHLLSIVIQAVLLFAILGVVLAIAASTTDAAEKAVLVVIGVVLVAAAWWIHRIDHAHPA